MRKIHILAVLLLIFAGVTLYDFFAELAKYDGYLSANVFANIERVESSRDEDSDGVDDYTDILVSARMQIGVVTEYDISYYSNGYPPDNKGACSDVIWRALKGAGYDLKMLVDSDMKKSPQSYSNSYDSNINFRRVLNLKTFFDRHLESLEKEIQPWDEGSLKNWQGGDFVTYAKIPGGLWHIAIVSDKRRIDGVPLLIHNYGSGVREDDYLMDWPTEITGHYRFVPK